MDLEYVAGVVAESVFGDRNTKLLGCNNIQTPSSLVFRLEYAIGGTSRVLFVKLPAEGKDNKQTAKIIQRLQREHYLIERVKSAFKTSPELEIVPSSGFIPDINGLVTSEVRGASLQDLISARLRFRYGRGTPELERLSGLAGKWLHRFHSLDIVGGKIDLRQTISTYCGDRLEVLARTKNSQISKLLSESLMRNISTWIDEALSNPETRTVLCHNDYSPHNIIVTDKGICVLDFSFSTPGLPAFDLACFWHKIEDLKGSLLRGNKGLETIQNHFLNTYGSSFDISRPEVKLGLARLVLSKMITLLDSRNNRFNGWNENPRRYSTYLSQLKSGFELAK